MVVQEQERRRDYQDKLSTYHGFIIALRYVILVHVAAASFWICWLAGAAIGWGVILALAVLAPGVYLIGPFRTDAEHPPLADPPYHAVKP
jgi:hypothetical protein